MALASGTNRIQYVVSTPTSDYNFPYKYWKASDLVVSVVDLTSGDETILDINAGDYTVSATNGDPALGAIVATVIAYDDHRVTIERVIPVESEADFVAGDGLPPDALNSEFDKSAARQQQFEDQATRQVSHPASDPEGLNYEAPTVENRASKALGYDASGNVIGIDLASSGTVSADATKGIAVTGNIISSKVDNVTIGFNAQGEHEVLIASILLAMYPVNSIYSSTSSSNPSALLGGTWTSFGSGRVPVGFDSGDADFDTSEKTGGEKLHTLTVTEIPPHSHDYADRYVKDNGTNNANNNTNDNQGSFEDLARTSELTGSGGAHNNLQPYIVVHMWKRTA